MRKKSLAPLALMVLPIISALAQNSEYINAEYFRRLHDPYISNSSGFRTVMSVKQHHLGMAQSMSKSQGIMEELAYITTTEYYKYFGVIPSDVRTLFMKQFLQAIPDMATDDRLVKCLLLMSRECQGEGQYLKRRSLSSMLNSFHQITKGNRQKYSKMPLPDIYDIVDLALHEKPSYEVVTDIGEGIVLPTSQADLGQRSSTHLILCLLLSERDFSDQAIQARSIIEKNTPADLFARSNDRRKEYECLSEDLSTVRSDTDLLSITMAADPRYLAWLFQQRIKAKRHENLEGIVYAIIEAGNVERAAAVFHNLKYSYKGFVLGKEAEDRILQKTCIIADGNASLDSRVCAMVLRYCLMTGRRSGTSSLQISPLDYESLYSQYSTSPDPLVVGMFSKLAATEGPISIRGKLLHAAERRCVDNPCFASIIDYMICTYEESQWEMLLGLPRIVP